MKELLSCTNLEKTMGNRVLFTGLSFRVHERERIGLIGPNGTGKSTLLKILNGSIDNDNGEIAKIFGLKLIYLPQIEELDLKKNILELALDASSEDIIEEYEKEANTTRILSQIGFTNLEQQAEELSGGWLKRLCIARQLARNPDILLLDEPTNHLDLEGVEWLENYLNKARFSYIVVTHDRRFLNKATNRIIELDEAFDGGMLSFNCPYDEFMHRKQDFLTAKTAEFEKLSNKNRREQEWVKAGVKARTTKQKSRLQDADILADDVAKLKKQTTKPDKILIDFESTDRKTKRLIVAHNISKSFDGNTVITDLDLTLSPGTRIGLLGKNGAGKSTLIKLLSGEETPDSGGVSITTGCSILHFDQKRQLVDETESLKDALVPSGSDTVTYRGKDMHITAWARKLKFKAEQLRLPVKALSGGERAKVIMGRLMLQTADVLLLDEPTNDLDIPSIEVLEQSLLDFPGAIILVTHDREMLDRVSTVLLALDGNGGVEAYSSYNQWKRATTTITEKQRSTKKQQEELFNNKKTLTKLTYKEQRELDMMEDNILKVEQALEILENNPVIYNENEPDNFSSYAAKLDNAQLSISNLYTRWEELEEKQKSLQKK